MALENGVFWLKWVTLSFLLQACDCFIFRRHRLQLHPGSKIAYYLKEAKKSEGMIFFTLKKLMVFAIHVTQCHLKYFLKRSSSRKKMRETAAIPINSYEMPCTKTSLCTVIAAQ